MPRPPPDLTRLSLILQARGVSSARDLTSALQVSPATLNRMVAQLDTSLERIGAARRTRYALRRSVRNLGSQWPIYQIGPDGRPRVMGELRSLHGGFRLAPRPPVPEWTRREYPEGLFTGLPFFLQDIRPHGYVGRAIARDAGSRLGLPVDPRLWSDDDVLSYLLMDGYDLPGDLVVGDRALEHALRVAGELPAGAIAETDRDRAYVDRAAAAQRGALVGSSAGGEQPKFVATVRQNDGGYRSVLVKFSAAEPSPVGERWADLLRCEHLAAEILRARGLASAPTQILAAGGRRFLEVERFDRVAAVGRRGLLTLGALEDALAEGIFSDWAATAVRCEQQQWITPEASRTLRWLWCFGDLIANSDMHRANASVWFGGALPFRLAPSYDMLPMAYAPGAQGELGERIFAPRPPLDAIAEVWSEAARAAGDFWERVIADPDISTAFRPIAIQNRDVVAGLLHRFG